ncbi:albumin-1 isoform X1 [Medicago truncatula]|uniref:albumin-1 isoform X1 n=1 Tax=Medicago truncatula TaxID=3880 RepID=UPI001967B8D3|nr:albumin-1 isoform X1 [Medicago truncatula]
MAYVKLAPFAVFLLAAFLMFPMKKIEGESCESRGCIFYINDSCPSGCVCDPIDPVTWAGVCVSYSSIKKKVEEHPNYCETHTECTKKGSGNFCARFANSDIKYGWCFASISEAENAFKIASTSEFKNDL